MGSDPVASRIIFDYRNGRDLTARRRGAFVIDAFGYDEEKLKAEAPAIYQHLLLNVKPGRDANRRDSIRQNWWVFGWLGRLEERSVGKGSVSPVRFRWWPDHQ